MALTKGRAREKLVRRWRLTLAATTKVRRSSTTSRANPKTVQSGKALGRSLEGVSSATRSDKRPSRHLAKARSTTAIAGAGAAAAAAAGAAASFEGGEVDEEVRGVLIEVLVPASTVHDPLLYGRGWVGNCIWTACSGSDRAGKR